MNNDPDFEGGLFLILVGICIGILLSIAIIYAFSEGEDKLNQCEASLPRDQKCVLIAVPESEA